MKPITHQSLLKKDLKTLIKYIKTINKTHNLKIPPKIAKITNTCTICKKSTKKSKQLTLNYGKEYAHTQCTKNQPKSIGHPQPK